MTTGFTSELLSTVNSYLEPILNEASCELFDLEFVKEGPNHYLRVFIDKEGGVTIDDCEFISRRLESRLDEADPIPMQYILEVSSPGVERPIKKDSDFEKYKGEQVEIKLYKPLNKSKTYSGTLLGLKDGIVSIRVNPGKKGKIQENNDIEIERAAIASCKLAFNWKGEVFKGK